jgi:hypothetical protein
MTACFIAMVVLVEPARATDNPFKLFKNYFVTGDFATAGKGLRSRGTMDPITGKSLAKDTISVDIPVEGAEILAAFLYWETLEKTPKPSAAKGYLSEGLNSPVRTPIFGKPIGGDRTAPCWSSGGSTGFSNGAPTLRVYRADVLRYLKVDAESKKKVANITVLLPDSGSNGSTTPITEGASLVVVYRHPGMKYKGIVIFDGAFTMNNDTDTLVQTIDGFDQASNDNPQAKIAYLVGDGQTNFPDLLSIGPTKTNQRPLGDSDVFKGSSGPTWDNIELETEDIRKAVTPGGSSLVTRAYHDKGSFDCLSWAAIVFSTTVQDSDSDGLLDTWEINGYTDHAHPEIGPVPLKAMGALPNRPDLFVEIDYMKDGDAHVHLPKFEALKMVAAAFANAPSPPLGPGSVMVHLDVGNNYQTAEYQKLGNTFIVPTPYAHGGDPIDEHSRATYCKDFLPESCLFPDQKGLVSWKKGLRRIQQMTVPGSNPVKRYFDDNRQPLFHYAIFAHGLAVKGDQLAQGFQARSVSGRGDLLGGDFIVSLGLWRSSIESGDTGTDSASKVLQAGTLLHELAHNLGGYHGGSPDGLNCKPNHESSLNYLYQGAGLLDLLGRATVDLSREVIEAPAGSQEELNLDEFLGVGTGAMKYRLRWYARKDVVENRLGIPITAAKGYCDGSAKVTNSGMVRVDGPDLQRKPIDWDFDMKTTGHPALDINFNGLQNTTAQFKGFNDWQFITMNHGFQQVGARRNLYGLSLGVGSEDLLRADESDSGEADLGEADLGEADLGEADLGEADLGEADLGEADLGAAGLGEADLGAISDMDYDTATSIGNAPTALSATATKAGITLNWEAPAIGVITQYTVYRADGPVAVKPLVSFAPVGPATLTFMDTAVKNNQVYTYFVVATYDDGAISGPSTMVTILNKP